MLRFIPVLALLLFTACGLAENEQDDKNKRIYITFADPAFERFCLGMFDLDHDGRISRYEAQRVLAMDCSGRNISAMWEIGEFSACASSIAAAIISRGSTCANAPTCKSSIAATTKSRRSTSTACAGLRSWTVPKTCSHAST